MHSSILYVAALLSVANAHGVIMQAVGDSGASVGFQVDSSIARNCTGISPCQQDTTIIRDAEIAANIVNECGRTELSGNIDVGENTENALAAGAVTKVSAGSQITVTIHQVNADGAGPYTCDLDQTSNSGVISQNLTVTNNVPGVNGLSQAKFTDFNMTVTLPDNLACTGASTGNVCTVRCRNNAVAGPFGGCFAVQQTDVKATTNNANTIKTAQTLDGITSQVAENIVDLPVAVAANQQQGTTEAVDGLKAVNDLLALSVTTKASPTQTLVLENVGTNVAVAAGGSTAADLTAVGATATSATTTKANKATKTAAAAAKATSATKGGKAAANAAQKGNKNARNLGMGMRWAKRITGDF